MTFFEYLGLLKDSAISTLKGMRVTGRVFWKVQRKGGVTIQYPEVRDAIPLGSRGLLFNDIEDCISCRQCAITCPCDAIYIEAEKKPKDAPVETTRAGSKKTLELKRYEIDASLCCYCGLCSASCPTGCLYHTKEYEYSKLDRDNLVFDYLDYKQ